LVCTFYPFFEILKLGENSNNLHFFKSKAIQGHIMSKKRKKEFSDVFSLCKAPKAISDLIIFSNGEK